MANLIKRTTGHEVGPSTSTWDPFQLMRELMGWEAYRTGFEPLVTRSRATYAPSFDVKETKDAYYFRADLPGLKDQDLDITLQGNQLTVAGHRQDERKEDERKGDAGRYHAIERWYGSFSRTFALPEGVDGEGVTAELKDGVLGIKVPKRPEVQPRKIDVRAKSARDADAAPKPSA